MRLLFTRFLIPVLLALCPMTIFAQALFQTSGDWDVAGNWFSGNIGDLITEDVTIDISKAAFINNVFSYTIGNLDFSNNAGLTINTTGSLDVGQSGTPKNLTANNNATITVSGTLIVWGDLIVNNNLDLVITGTLIVKGNILMNNNATLSVAGGLLTVNGNFTGGSNTFVSITGSGQVGVGGAVSVGNSSSLIGPAGSFHAHSCTEGGSSSFCTSGTLPLEFLFFKGAPKQDKVLLNWATASELNVAYFIIEKSYDGMSFYEIGQVEGHGTTKIKQDYSFSDEKPTLGRAYYRLTEGDYDNSQTHLKVISVDFTGVRIASVYPNPVTNGQLNIELNFVPDNEVMVSIVDLRGVTLSEFNLNKQNVPVSVQVSAGMYLLTVKSNDFKSINRLVVK